MEVCGVPNTRNIVYNLYSRTFSFALQVQSGNYLAFIVSKAIQKGTELKRTHRKFSVRKHLKKIRKFDKLVLKILLKFDCTDLHGCGILHAEHNLSNSK